MTRNTLIEAYGVTLGSGIEFLFYFIFIFHIIIYMVAGKIIANSAYLTMTT